MILQPSLFVTNSGYGDNSTAPQGTAATPFQIISSPDGAVLFEATALNDIAYESNSNVAYEPQENGVFSANSKQNMPFQLQCNITVTPMLINPSDTLDSVSELVLNAKYTLQDIKDSDQIVIVIKNDYYYDNMTLKGIYYYQSPKNPFLMCLLTFQEVRVANVTFQTLTPSKVSDPANATQTTSGQVQTTNPNINAVTQAPNNLNPVGTINNDGTLNLG